MAENQAGHRPGGRERYLLGSSTKVLLLLEAPALSLRAVPCDRSRFLVGGCSAWNHPTVPLLPGSSETCFHQREGKAGDPGRLDSRFQKVP